MELIVDFSKPSERLNCIQQIQSLTGKHRIGIVQFRERRSDRQNRAYWPCIVVPFCELLRNAGYDYTPEIAHEILKTAFLEQVKVDEQTGEVKHRWVRSTTELDTKEFAAFVEQCCRFLAEEYQFVVRIGS